MLQTKVTSELGIVVFARSFRRGLVQGTRQGWTENWARRGRGRLQRTVTHSSSRTVTILGYFSNFLDDWIFLKYFF